MSEIETSEKAGQLLPCPFCGGEASRRYTDDHPKGQAKLHIECDVCNAARIGNILVQNSVSKIGGINVISRRVSYRRR